MFRSRLGVRLDVVDGLLDGGDFLGFLVGTLGLELLLQRHHQLDGVERVRAQVIDERRLVRDFGFVDSELLGDDLLDALFDVFHPRLLPVGAMPVRGSRAARILRHIHAAVDVQHCSRDVAAAGRNAIGDGSADVLRRAEPPARRLVSITSSQSASFMRSARLSRVMPALFTRIRTSPNSFWIDSTSASHCGASLTFRTLPMAGTFCAPASLVAVPITFAPCLASSVAIARPMPRDAPVTSATLPSSMLMLPSSPAASARAKPGRQARMTAPRDQCAVGP